MTIGERIKKLRNDKGLSLRALSKEVDISISFLSDIENSRSMPSINRLKDISIGLGCSVSYLLGENKVGAVINDNSEIYLTDVGKQLENLINDKIFCDIISEIEDFYLWNEDKKLALLEIVKKNK